MVSLAKKYRKKELVPLTGADHNGCGGGQAQGAGAGDDQDRHPKEEGKEEAVVALGEPVRGVPARQTGHKPAGGGGGRGAPGFVRAAGAGSWQGRMERITGPQTQPHTGGWRGGAARGSGPKQASAGCLPAQSSSVRSGRQSDGRRPLRQRLSCSRPADCSPGEPGGEGEHHDNGHKHGGDL